jgi:hypothetical protein
LFCEKARIKPNEPTRGLVIEEQKNVKRIIIIIIFLLKFFLEEQKMKKKGRKSKENLFFDYFSGKISTFFQIIQ